MQPVRLSAAHAPAPAHDRPLTAPPPAAHRWRARKRPASKAPARGHLACESQNGHGRGSAGLRARCGSSQAPTLSATRPRSDPGAPGGGTPPAPGGTRPGDPVSRRAPVPATARPVPGPEEDHRVGRLVGLVGPAMALEKGGGGRILARPHRWRRCVPLLPGLSLQVTRRLQLRPGARDVLDDAGGLSGPTFPGECAHLEVPLERSRQPASLGVLLALWPHPPGEGPEIQDRKASVSFDPDWTDPAMAAMESPAKGLYDAPHGVWAGSQQCRDGIWVVIG